jgi:shikimate dehydrogenase
MNDRKIFAVAGRPVLHSLSPRLFRAAYPGGGDPTGLYTRFSASTAGEALAFARETGLAGLNITAPLKESVFAHLASFDEVAAALGAANTLVRDGDGYRGFNTDPAGVAGAFAKAGVDVRGRRALVLGAGGAGRAAAFALRGLGADVVLCSRTDGKAVAAAAKLGVAAAPWADRPSILAGRDVLVSCLASDAEAVHPDWLRPGLVVLEASYPEPPLTRAARALGCTVIPGEDWLLRQAVPAFRLFTGLPPDEAAMAAALYSIPKRFSRGALNVALVGFMGSGKTTVGRRLAEKLGLRFEDSDALVERRMGQSIPEIFRGPGEAAFREGESRALREILDGRTGVACACGGGSMERAENRALVARTAIVVWLHAPAGVCRSRIDAATRPLLDLRAGSAAAFEALFQARLSCYAEAADLAAGSDGPEELAARTIHEEIRRVVAD